MTGSLYSFCGAHYKWYGSFDKSWFIGIEFAYVNGIQTIQLHWTISEWNVKVLMNSMKIVNDKQCNNYIDFKQRNVFLKKQWELIDLYVIHLYVVDEEGEQWIGVRRSFVIFFRILILKQEIFFWKHLENNVLSVINLNYIEEGEQWFACLVWTNLLKFLMYCIFVSTKKCFS